MPHVNINFNEVPDKLEQVPAGVYLCEVAEASVEPTKDGSSTKVVVQLKIQDGPHTGRTIYDHIGLKGKPISLKQLAKGCGVEVGADGLDTNDLVGKSVSVRVKTRTYNDPATGEVKETSSVGEYLTTSA